jgi:D-alanine transaminase
LKTTSLIGNVLMRQFAADRGASETLLFRDGLLTEGAATNVLIVEEGVILAPPQDWRVLPGITFGAVRDLAKAHGLPLELRDIGEAELRQADEIWLASSLRELLAVTRLDGQPVGNGRPGPVWRRMRELFQHAK